MTVPESHGVIPETMHPSNVLEAFPLNTKWPFSTCTALSAPEIRVKRNGDVDVSVTVVTDGWSVMQSLWYFVRVFGKLALAPIWPPIVGGLALWSIIKAP